MPLALEHAFCELKRRRTRASLTIVGYALAIASMIVLVGILRAWGRSSAGILDHTGTHFVVYSPFSTGSCACGVPAAPDDARGEGFVAFGGTLSNLMPISFGDRIKSQDAIEDAAPYLCYRFRDPADEHLFSVGGLDLDRPMVLGTTSCAPSDVIEGRFLDSRDAGKALIERAYAQARRLAVGDLVSVVGRSFAVAGIVDSGIRPAKADIYLPYAEAEEVISARLPNLPISGQANMILVEVKKSSVQAQAIREVRALYPDLIVSSYSCYKPAAEAETMNAAAIAISIAAIAVFTVLLSMLSQASVLVERRRELGIMKAMGFPDGRIITQILLESLIQAAMGAIAASVSIVALMPVALAIFPASGRLSAAIPWPAIGGMALGLAVAGGLLAGILPAIWAGRQPPSRLLRSF